MNEIKIKLIWRVYSFKKSDSFTKTLITNKSFGSFNFNDFLDLADLKTQKRNLKMDRFLKYLNISKSSDIVEIEFYLQPRVFKGRAFWKYFWKLYNQTPDHNGWS